MAFLLCLLTRHQASGVRQFATVAARMRSSPRQISYRACRVDVVSESCGHERCGSYFHLLSRGSTESTPRSCPAVGLEEPQEGLTGSQLHTSRSKRSAKGSKLRTTQHKIISDCGP